MNLIKIAQNHIFTKMPKKILDICNSRVIWKYHPSDMYIISHTIGSIDDGIRYSYISFCAKLASISLVDFSADVVASKKYFSVKV